MTGELFVALRHEELPYEMIPPALAGLREGLLELIKGVGHGRVTTFCTPRRMAVRVQDVESARPVVERLVTGPPASVAFQDGEPTRAALGFARGKGVDPSALEVVDGPRGPVCAVKVKEGGEETAPLVAAGLERVVLDIPFAKSMEWGEGGVRFGRPLHDVSALFDGEVIAGTVVGIEVGDHTEGHRFHAERRFHFSSCEEWLTGLRERMVEPDHRVREARIHEQLSDAVDQLEADSIDHPELLEEVVQLVEWPVLVVGSFAEDLLQLPPRLLEKTMKAHQRYFPVHRGGELTHFFAVISNNPWAKHDVVAEGNARVLRARFHDARFFFAEDKKQPLTEHGEELEKMLWIKGLGTMADKQDRVARTAERLAPLTGARGEVAAEAGSLCKADLCTQMVGEFPDLQGHMGRLYATAEGRDDAVAAAIEEHYLPRFADDALPASSAGAAVALADRLDTLVGCFSIGMVPKGSGDPQGLRRAASGVLRILADRGLREPLPALFSTAMKAYHEYAIESETIYGFDLLFKVLDDEAPAEEVARLTDMLVEFTLTRFAAVAGAGGATQDLVDAVVSVSDPDVIVLQGKVDALQGLVGTERFEPILQTFKRVLNITVDQDAPSPARDALEEPAERLLAAAIDTAGADAMAAVERLDFAVAVDQMLALQAPFARFFDDVLVDDPDPAVKARRMGLLIEVASVFRSLADFTRISTR